MILTSQWFYIVILILIALIIKGYLVCNPKCPRCGSRKTDLKTIKDRHLDDIWICHNCNQSFPKSEKSGLFLKKGILK